MPNPQTLTEAEIAGLEATLDDEYKSFETYAQVIEDFGFVRPFINIVQAEERHYSALLKVFARYHITPPANDWSGKAPRFATVHEACLAAVAGEIANVSLYDDALKITQRPDIISAYQALRSASQDRHLPAFQRCARRGQSRDDGRPRGIRA